MEFKRSNYTIHRAGFLNCISQKPIEIMAMPPTRSGAYSLHANSSDPTTSQVIAFIPSVECHRFVFLNAFEEIF